MRQTKDIMVYLFMSMLYFLDYMLNVLVKIFVLKCISRQSCISLPHVQSKQQGTNVFVSVWSVTWVWSGCLHDAPLFLYMQFWSFSVKYSCLHTLLTSGRVISWYMEEVNDFVGFGCRDSERSTMQYCTGFCSPAEYQNSMDQAGHRSYRGGAWHSWVCLGGRKRAPCEP